MTSRILIAAALAVAAGTMPAMAASITSDPDATMNEQQKLGPNEVTHQVGNAAVTHRHGHVYGRAYAPAYGYYQGPAYGYYGAPTYRYEPVPAPGW